ncbi:retrovirus-related pol polyprotein from transposon TNT 1-94, partial [Tanacetum coccineum]
ERKNKTLIEAATTMLADSKLPTTFWAEAVFTACYVHNRVLIVKPHNKTPYELFRGIKPTIGFMKPFGCHVTILNTLDKLGKFDGKSDEGFFVGYSLSRIYEAIWMSHNKTPYELFRGIKPAIGFMKPFGCHVTILNTLDKLGKFIRDCNTKRLIQMAKIDTQLNVADLLTKGFDAGRFQYLEEPKRISQALRDSAWVEAMQEELLQFKLQKVWILVDLPKVYRAIGTKCLYRNKKDERGIVIRNKARLIERGGIQGVSESSTSSQQDQDNQDCIVLQVNTGSREVSTAVPEVNTATPEDLMGPIPTSEDTQVEDQEIELGNISPSYAVSSTPHTRIHKDHPINHVIRDV